MTAITALLLSANSHNVTTKTVPSRRRHHVKNILNATSPGWTRKLMATATQIPSASGLQSMMTRPQVGIERLPTRRLANEPRESMNCKSCRKRKIKCNRLRPSCEACQVFQCACVYDAVPKKRGPKTDVLEALLKRVDGLEAQLKDKKSASTTPPPEVDPSVCNDNDNEQAALPAEQGQTLTPIDQSPTYHDSSRSGRLVEPAVCAPSPVGEPVPVVRTEVLLNTYFSRFHGKPFYILDEASLRQRVQLNQIPAFLAHAIYAVAARCTHLSSDRQASARLSEDYAARARAEIETDEPSIQAVQALLLLVAAFTASGMCKKAYMLLTTAVGMVMALELHREMNANARATPVEREMRRRLFWSCYLMDTFLACGSKRPSLISDEMILLRLPCWSPSPASLPVGGDFFQSTTPLSSLQGAVKKAQGSSGLLIDITRILGNTSRYLARGGVTGDSHFPWHSLSSLSKIRQELDAWVLGADDAFSSIEGIFNQPDATVLALGKLIYHLIHCLIYRPFLPINLAELAGPGQYQSWQIEATNMCFAHADAIADLVAFGMMQNASMEWPAFVAYCICTAGTVHIHGACYGDPSNATQMAVFGSSRDLLARAMQHLEKLQSVWTSVQRQHETLQSLWNVHSVLVRNIVDDGMPQSTVFHQEDFFDRYLCLGELNRHAFSFDAANLSLPDLSTESDAGVCGGGGGGGGYYKMHATGGSTGWANAHAERAGRKRRNTDSSVSPSSRRRSEYQMAASHVVPTYNLPSPDVPSLPTPPSYPRAFQAFQGTSTSPPQASSDNMQAQMVHPSQSEVPMAPQTAYSMQQQLPSLLPALTPPAAVQDREQSLQSFNDPMFGGVPTGSFPSPALWNGDDAAMRPAISEPSRGGGGGAGAEIGGGGEGGGGGGGSTNSIMFNGATGEGASEEKDPFLSLLEQLAESESARGFGELDLFLGGVSEVG